MARFPVKTLLTKSAAWLASARIAASHGPITDVSGTTVYAKTEEDARVARGILERFLDTTCPDCGRDLDFCKCDSEEDENE